MAKTPTSTTNSSAGFSLIELLVVLLLLGLAYGLAAPSLSRVIAGNDVRLAARELAAALNEARAGALTSGRERRFVLDAAANAYGVGQATRPLPRDVQIAATVPGSRRLSQTAATIDFFPDGSSSGGRVIVGAPSGASRTLVVDFLTGRVTAVE